MKLLATYMLESLDRREIYRTIWFSPSEGGANSIKNTINLLKKRNSEDIRHLIEQVLKGQKSLEELC